VVADGWRTLDACPAKTTQTAIGANAVALTSDECAASSRVEMVTVDGQGHVWFKTPDTTQLALDFLASAVGR
jgi:poly(3-hydroxybutyrate) depolymerase